MGHFEQGGRDQEIGQKRQYNSGSGEFSEVDEVMDFGECTLSWPRDMHRIGLKSTQKLNIPLGYLEILLN